MAFGLDADKPFARQDVEENIQFLHVIDEVDLLPQFLRQGISGGVHLGTEGIDHLTEALKAQLFGQAHDGCGGGIFFLCNAADADFEGFLGVLHQILQNALFGLG